eukprot:17338_1
MQRLLYHQRFWYITQHSFCVIDDHFHELSPNICAKQWIDCYNGTTSSIKILRLSVNVTISSRTRVLNITHTAHHFHLKKYVTALRVMDRMFGGHYFQKDPAIFIKIQKRNCLI